MSINNEIMNYILNISGQDKIGDDENLFESGILNSLHVLDIISFIENNYNIRINDDDVDMDNFSTIGALSLLVKRKLM